MRIAVVSTPFVRVPPGGYGGTELFCHELVEGLVARGHDVLLYATGDSSASCPVRAIVPRPVWPPDFETEATHAAFALADAARAGVDVVQLNGPIAVPMTRLVELPAVCTIHHRAMPTSSAVYAGHPGVRFVAISARQRDLEARLADVHVVHHGVDPRRYPPSARDEGHLLHLGRYAEEKGTHVAIDVARRAGLPLVLAGRTHAQDEAYFATEVAPRLGGPGVREVGEASGARKTDLLRGARALLAPIAWEEPFGLVAIEAMLCGTPVLGFARGAFPEIVDEGVTGFLFAPGDVDGLVRAARAVGRFDRARCAARARERFASDVMVRRYEALYRDLVASRRGRLSAA
jgi:glycosyltransferase involved in cell wall biosynthesis